MWGTLAFFLVVALVVSLAFVVAVSTRAPRPSTEGAGSEDVFFLLFALGSLGHLGRLPARRRRAARPGDSVARAVRPPLGIARSRKSGRAAESPRSRQALISSASPA
jgi:hypothetical protein